MTDGVDKRARTHISPPQVEGAPPFLNMLFPKLKKHTKVPALGLQPGEGRAQLETFGAKRGTAQSRAGHFFVDLVDV